MEDRLFQRAIRLTEDVDPTLLAQLHELSQEDGSRCSHCSVGHRASLAQREQEGGPDDVLRRMRPRAGARMNRELNFSHWGH